MKAAVTSLLVVSVLVSATSVVAAQEKKLTLTTTTGRSYRVDSPRFLRTYFDRTGYLLGGQDKTEILYCLDVVEPVDLPDVERKPECLSLAQLKDVTLTTQRVSDGAMVTIVRVKTAEGTPLTKQLCTKGAKDESQQAWACRSISGRSWWVEGKIRLATAPGTEGTDGKIYLEQIRSITFE